MKGTVMDPGHVWRRNQLMRLEAAAQVNEQRLPDAKAAREAEQLASGREPLRGSRVEGSALTGGVYVSVGSHPRVPWRR